MNSTFTDVRKKWVVILMFSACVLSLIIILMSEQPVSKTLHDLAEIDEVIRTELLQLNLPADNIRARTMQVDSLFERKNYIIEVPGGFPVTTFHARFAQQLQPRGVGVSGFRTFPEQSLDLYITFAGKLVRRVHIRHVVDSEP